MRDDTMWGGGGEVVGLTHVLKRPIHVYELIFAPCLVGSKIRRCFVFTLCARMCALVFPACLFLVRRFALRPIGKFGAPLYSAEKPIHVVSTYARFPDLDPGSQSAEGNHYVAVYP
ncbi:unnamed protein product, partial [Hapterophycus canaliculatus]